MMLLNRFRRSSPQKDELPTGPPPPTDPIELGLLLRSARERLELELDDIRDQISVPRVDLVALESGQLSLLHTERAGAVALWRFAEVLGLDAESLVRILHEHWPRPTQGHLTIRTFAGVELPIAQIAAASVLLVPITGVASRSARSRPLGLSTGTRSTLAAASARRNLGVELLGPSRPSRRRSTRTLLKPEDVDETQPLAELPAAFEQVPDIEMGEIADNNDQIDFVEVPVIAEPSPSEVGQARPPALFDQSPSLLDDVPGLTDEPFLLFDADGIAGASDVLSSTGQLAVPESEERLLHSGEDLLPDQGDDRDRASDSGELVGDDPLLEDTAVTLLPSFPTPQAPEVVQPVARRAKTVRGRTGKRLRITGKKTEAQRGADAGDDDAALQRLLANVPLDQHEILLRNAVDRLETREREVLRLVIWDELSHSAAASRMNLSERELLELLGRARLSFRRELVMLARTSD